MKRTLSFSSALLLCLVMMGTAAAQTAPADPSSGLFTGKDAEATLTQALVNGGAGDDVRVTITQAREEDVLAQSSGSITAEADGLEIDKAHSTWQALLLLKADGKNLAPIKLSGRYEEMARIPVLKVRVQSPDVISENDIDWDSEPVQRLRKNTVTDAHDLIGKSPRHSISPGRPIRLDEVSGPTIVNKGTQVTLFYRTRNLEIKTFGEAMETGAKGDVIRVRNSASKAVIQGPVESAGRVLVTSPDSDAAEAM